VRRVRGNVVGDESYFRGEALGQGWLWEDAQWYYGAEPSALTVDGNEFSVGVTPASKAGEPVEVKLTPPFEDAGVTNDARTVERGARPTLGITRALSANDVRVWGEFPAGGAGLSVRLAVQRPAMRAARLFRQALVARGIEVTGEARTSDARRAEGERFDPGARPNSRTSSARTLAEVSRETNKESVNLYAELILRALGRERGAEAPDPTRAATPRATQTLPASPSCAVGSNASALTRARSRYMTAPASHASTSSPPLSAARLLTHMAGAPSARSSATRCPRPDATVRSPGACAARRPRGVFRQDGSLTYVNALAGYATTAAGEPLAFAVICNDKTGARSNLSAFDSIVLQLTRHPGPDMP
jgi:D-alanyl-D-alanine carboxypeptidase/D-alanyl-D-alanine-endopeptidase (penicillin-binding protein 4)